MEGNRKILMKFKLAIFKSGKKQKDIAAIIKVGAPHLNNMLNGRDRMSKEHRKNLNKVLNTNY